jgi:predicted transglutaminase-like cysteine proteinase
MNKPKCECIGPTCYCQSTQYYVDKELERDYNPEAIIVWVLGAMLFAGIALIASCSHAGELEEVNQYVNKTMKYVSDREQYGVKDYWNGNCPPQGDCEDAALCKARMLADRGYDKSNLILLMAGRHAVLVVDNKVLDNKTDTMLSFEEWKSTFWFDKVYILCDGKGAEWEACGEYRKAIGL